MTIKNTSILTLLLLPVLFLSFGCSKNQRSEIMEEMSLMKDGDKAVVLLFWAAECPLCLNYYADMVKMGREYNSKGIPFYFVFTGADAKSEEVESFLLKFSEKEKYVLDPEISLAQAFNATVTPQAIVVNRGMDILYSGKIDNWMKGLGQKRQVVDSFYLKDALIAIENGERPKISTTEPVGCFIQ